jgi:hypothetical protein
MYLTREVRYTIFLTEKFSNVYHLKDLCKDKKIILTQILGGTGCAEFTRWGQMTTGNFFYQLVYQLQSNL